MEVSAMDALLCAALLAIAVIAYRLFFSQPTLPPLKQSTAATGGAGGAKANGLHVNGVAREAAASSSSSPSRLPMSVLFGSQSGTAEAFARELAEEATMFGYAAAVKDLQDWDADEELKREALAVFLLATFGEGEPTDNATAFYSWITDERRTDTDAAGIPFAVFALGNRQYEHFCKVGRVADERLAALGGVRVVDRGEGDDDGSLEGDFRTWKAAFWQATNARFGMSAAADGAAAETRAFQSAFVVSALPEPQQSQQQAAYRGGLANLVTDPKHRVVVAPVLENRELRQWTADGGSTRHIEIDLSTVSLPYLTADNAGIYPRNDCRQVDAMLQRLGLDGQQLVLMKGNGSKRSFLPSPCRVQDIFLYYLDIGFSPRLSQLPLLSRYCSDDADRQRLHHLSHAGQEAYVAEHYSFLELLSELPSMRPPLSDVVDWMPRLSPRFYTISSSSLVQPRRISLTVSVITHHKPRGRQQPGVCSSYLASLTPGTDSVAVFIRPSSFRLPKQRPASASSPSPPPAPPPILMVGPGTGIAPFRGFIQEARAMRAKGQQGLHCGALHLFFGCRQSTRDFIYRDELEAAVRDAVLAQLHLAFSREDRGAADSGEADSGCGVSASATAAATASLASSSLDAASARSYVKKVYVQDRMRGVTADVWQALHHSRGLLFVCGGTAMGRAVREVLLECCRERGGMSDKQAELYVKKLQEQKRFVQELWS